VVIGGHQRLVAARRLGYKQVPTIFVDLSAEQSHVLNLALNKISGDWDEELLARMLADLQASAIDLEVSGFDGDEINRLLEGLEASDKRDRLETFDLEAALADA
jgi:ParB-like chromosome segregation protein Spo0J